MSPNHAADPALHEDGMRTACHTWAMMLAQDGPVPSEEMILAKRYLHLGSERDGLVPIKGNLLPEAAALLERINDAINNPHRNTKEGDSKADDSANDDARALATGDTRTPSQKRHDTFVTILEAASRQSEMPCLGGAPVTVMIQTTVEDMEACRSGWLHSHDGMTPIPAATINHSACCGDVQFYAENSEGKITNLWTPSRIYNAGQRRAVAVRDGGCVIPGCTVGPSWCEIHHVIEWFKCGTTDISNAAMLCYYHHRTLGTSGWQIKMIDGVPYVKAPPWLDPDQQWKQSRPPHKPVQRKHAA